MISKKAHNILDEEEASEYVLVNIIDSFPHDHPLLEKDPGVYEDAEEMRRKLDHIVKNDFTENEIDGYMFVYDSSNRNTYLNLLCLIETMREIEKSKMKGKTQLAYVPKKIVVGNKKDLKK